MSMLRSTLTREKRIGEIVTHPDYNASLFYTFKGSCRHCVFADDLDRCFICSCAGVVNGTDKHSAVAFRRLKRR